LPRFGPAVDGGVVLSGHSDVVPVEGQDWTSDPFAMTERDGALYGRGACDMKGFIACVMAMAPEIARWRPTRPVHVALTYDEEVGCIGARALADDFLRARGLRPAIAIIGEPTGMRLIHGHKGCCEYTTEFAGLAGHGSDPGRGVNAVAHAVRYAGRLMELAEALKDRTPPESGFAPPWSTINIGRIAGGSAHNVIPAEAEIEWDLRPVVEADAAFVRTEIDRYAAEVLLPEMRRVHPRAAIRRHVVGEIAGLEPMEANRAADLVAALTGDNGRGLVSFGTEAGIFQGIGIDCVVCGPGFIEQAHKADEFVARDQLARCLDMLEGLRGHVS
jgi:acetylornithine deacetylase